MVNSKKKENELACIITTDKRGVFMGYIDPEKRPDASIVARDVRMVVYWSADVRGLLGLAVNGPTKGCRITEPAPSATLHGVTSVLEITDKAEKEFQKGHWG